MVTLVDLHHVVIGYFGSSAGDGVADRQDIYIDGTLAVSRTGDFATALPFGAGTLSVGNRAAPNNAPLDGLIDELAMYDLSAAASESDVATAR
ncbi:MAG: hypothetical protein IID42_04115 [Planctomycetes bacterium]|nr:hypothetical protein [Planctomycetota bacterium]